MFQFAVNPRDNAPATGAAACNTCCCQSVDMRPGETNLWRLLYAKWSVPIGGHGLTGTPQVTVERTGPTLVQPQPGSRPPSTPKNQQLNDGQQVLTIPLLGRAGPPVVPAIVTDPDLSISVPITIEMALTAFWPRFGTAHVSPTENGAIVYNPDRTGYAGIDRIFYKATDAQQNSSIGEIVIQRHAPGKAPTNFAGVVLPPLPAIDIIKAQATINQRGHFVDVPVSVGANARVGDVHRATIIQTAMNCENHTFRHVSCFDIRIKEC